jgi:hypothetical protein
VLVLVLVLVTPDLDSEYEHEYEYEHQMGRRSFYPHAALNPSATYTCSSSVICG